MSWTIEIDSFRQVLVWVANFLVSLSGNILFIVLLLLLSRVVRSRFRALAERRRMHRSVPALVDNAVNAVVYVFIGFVVLAMLGVNTRSLATFAGLVTAALALSLQDVFKNIFCGFYLLAERPFSPGDRIRIGSEDGVIERIDLRVTHIRNDRQELVLVPNSLFFSQMSVARSTLQRRSLTVQIAGIQAQRAAAETAIGSTIAEVVSDASASTARLLKIAPDGCDFEVTVSRVEAEDQERVIAALSGAFPDATITVVAR
jgi:small-conductance mechanosensitive channel